MEVTLSLRSTGCSDKRQSQEALPFVCEAGEKGYEDSAKWTPSIITEGILVKES